jgi:pimeloyl-ACP methyl ester carboxylesterase
MSMQRLTIHIPDEVLTDLRERLARTRWPGDFGNEDWAYGTEQSYLARLVRYWQDGFDWRAQERAINTFSHYRATVDGLPIHFIHEKGKGPHPMPLILTHGWPWTFWDLYKVIRPLADPAAFGGDPRDAFDVVVPSLPGYGFSTPLTKTGVNYVTTADLWVKLMQDVLGYPRFAAQGGDWGAAVTGQLGHKYADRVIGIHLTMLFPIAFASQGFPPPSEYSAEEQEGLQRFQQHLQTGSGYSSIQMTKPQTLSYAMNDSPAGMCAWLLEKRRDWSSSKGDVEKVFTADELLTSMTIYWATQSFATAARYYYEAVRNPWQPSHSRTPLVEAPTAAAILPQEIIHMPRSWAERQFNLKRWTPFPEGGHFAPMEQPLRLVEDIRAFFRTLRAG